MFSDGNGHGLKSIIPAFKWYKISQHNRHGPRMCLVLCAIFEVKSHDIYGDIYISVSYQGYALL